MQIANAPEISSVQRKPVVRTNSGRSTEHESFATDVVDHRLFFEFIDLPTQPAHMHVHKIASRNELVIPNFLKQHCARQQLILPAHHVFEQAKFTRQEVDRALTPFGGTRQQIELERTDAQQGIAVLRRPPQQGFSRAISSTIANGLVR